MERLLKGDLSQNMPLSDGDILQIPKKETISFQIMGEVKQPGSHTFERGPTILEAIVAVGGLTERADRNRVLLTHANSPEPTLVDLDQVVGGAAGANVTLQPGDILSVG